MHNITALLAFLLVITAMAIGDIVSIKTKAFIPSVFITAVIFLFGYWYIFPQDIINIANLGQPIVTLMMYLLIVHMGTLMNFRELLLQWKTVLISLAGIIGIIIFLMTIGIALLGKTTAIVGTPPLTGGIVAAILMKDAATAIGNDKLAILAILVYVIQGFVGYPLTAILLKKEGIRLLNCYKKGKNSNKILKIENEKIEKKLIPQLPNKYNTIYMHLFRLGLVAWIADIFTKSVNNNIFHNPKAISPFVIALIFGIIAKQIGLVEKEPLIKANSFGWAMTTLMAFIFGGLNKATPDMLKQVALPLIGIIIIGIIGLLIFAWIAGKIFQESKYMALSIALNALYGFPPNFILTTEVIHSLTDEEKEIKYLTDIMMPKMLIGGFTSVTIASVIVGGIFADILQNID